MSDAQVESHIPGSTPQILGPQRVAVTASIKPSPAPANGEDPVLASSCGQSSGEL